MSKIVSSASMSNNQSFETTGSVLRRNRRVKCFCQDESVICTVSDMDSVSYRRKFWGCRNYKNYMDKGCNFFKWLGDEIVDEMDLKIDTQKKKISKLKNATLCTRGWLKMSTVVEILSLKFYLVFVTMYFK
ncbi:unnamed protein product [Lathyrus oleraceus]